MAEGAYDMVRAHPTSGTERGWRPRTRRAQDMWYPNAHTMAMHDLSRLVVTPRTHVFRSLYGVSSQCGAPAA